MIIVLLVSVIFGCYEDNQQTIERKLVDRQQEIYSKSSPIPMYDASLERERIIALYNARMAATQTWSVWRSMTGMIEGDCPSSGYPIPYSVQLSSPESVQPVGLNGNRLYERLPQAEPNGLFTNGVTSNATWVFCVADGKIAPTYVEGLVTAYTVPLNVDYETNRVTPISDAAPSITLKK